MTSRASVIILQRALNSAKDFHDVRTKELLALKQEMEVINLRLREHEAEIADITDAMNTLFKERP